MLILTVHIFDNIVRYVPALLISILKTWIQNFNFIDLISIDIPRQWSLLCLSLHVVVVPKNKSDSIKRAPITDLKNDNCANLTSVTKFINFWNRYNSASGPFSILSTTFDYDIVSIQKQARGYTRPPSCQIPDSHLYKISKIRFFNVA